MCQDYSERVIEILLEKIDTLEAENRNLRTELGKAMSNINLTGIYTSYMDGTGNWHMENIMVCPTCSCLPCRCL